MSTASHATLKPASRGIGPRHAVYIDNPIFNRPAYTVQHPLAIPRTQTVYELCRELNWLPTGALLASSAASRETLCRIHDPNYVEALYRSDQAAHVLRQNRVRYRFGTMENPLFKGVFARAATTVGGSILAAQAALGGNVAFHPAGGTHHGQRSRASGFCYFNDPVFALLTLLDASLDRVLYLDFDAHHGDGVETAFITDPRVHLLSIHEMDRWPHTGTTSIGQRIRNLPVKKGCTDDQFVRLFEDVVLPFVETINPQAVVITCGADCLAGDPLSEMQLSNIVLWSAVEQICDAIPTAVVLGGGGYNPWTVARCWSGLWARLAGFKIPGELSERAIQILGALDSDLIDDEDVDDAWISSIQDARPGRASARVDQVA